mmetsp:Transcript_22661/g.56849  ORF Transcript_22661/g.56849 Transcript_22661/m.56849 type:complete len:143 (+) Transcript_22661:120-548(+)|eukprot:CAMPEP_0177652922 /NCGR_PEP_ID=MMETSP0447-20121125/13428_1 /TAXON_ID=0 /ORGANISM="Stygamoeba regulata, Strain BSH-02190019" /LENGTH=142 /DNA_ID=CAMNT_0019156279 /DNA_START=112 /DNA_END=540 /DNA_ORIENTATION=+
MFSRAKPVAMPVRVAYRRWLCSSSAEAEEMYTHRKQVRYLLEWTPKTHTSVVQLNTNYEPFMPRSLWRDLQNATAASKEPVIGPLRLTKPVTHPTRQTEGLSEGVSEGVSEETLVLEGVSEEALVLGKRTPRRPRTRRQERE